MKIWYRASPSDKIENAFSGDGGLKNSARWNHLGRKVIYCSDSIALCTLEWLAHNGLSVSGFSYYRYSIQIPNELICSFTLSDLPKDWDATPANDITRDFSDENLFNSQKFLAMALPSVIVPEEFNLIINPLHEKFSKIFESIRMIGKYTAPSRK